MNIQYRYEPSSRYSSGNVTEVYANDLQLLNSLAGILMTEYIMFHSNFGMKILFSLSYRN